MNAEKKIKDIYPTIIIQLFEKKTHALMHRDLRENTSNLWPKLLEDSLINHSGFFKRPG